MRKIHVLRFWHVTRAKPPIRSGVERAGSCLAHVTSSPSRFTASEPNKAFALKLCKSPKVVHFTWAETCRRSVCLWPDEAALTADWADKRDWMWRLVASVNEEAPAVRFEAKHDRTWLTEQLRTVTYDSSGSTVTGDTSAATTCTTPPPRRSCTLSPASELCTTHGNTSRNFIWDITMT